MNRDMQKEMHGVDPSFSGFVWEPSSEQEVVALFFWMMPHLDRRFAVWRVGTTYPDCECYEFSDGSWRLCRIEFEFKSSNFNHDPSGCDLIVCWVDDVPEKKRVPVLALSEFRDKIEHLILRHEPLGVRRQWDRASLEETVAPDKFPFWLTLYRFLVTCEHTHTGTCYIRYGFGKSPCYMFRVAYRAGEFTPVSAPAAGIVEITFQEIPKHLSTGFTERLREAPSFSQDRVSETWKRFPLANLEDLIALERAIVWLLGECGATKSKEMA